MRVLFIGGTGLISSACTDLALERGMDVVHVNRGTHADPRPGVTSLVADIRDETAASAVLAGRRFDAVVDFIAFRPDDIERDLRLFSGRVGQLVFVSSATVYRKPFAGAPVPEDWPLGNPLWAYARDKIACEERLGRAIRDEGFPGTIVRPSHTYGRRSIPLAVRSLGRPFTAIARMRAGKSVIVPGDGSSLWTLTHVDDVAVGLVGLLGRREALGQAFNIMSDEALTWGEIYRETAEAAGVDLRAVHMPSTFIAECLPDIAGRLLGDAAVSSVFDSGKLRRLVPDFRPAIPFADGIAQAVAWYDADPVRREVDEELDARWDHLIDAWEDGLDHARRAFQATG